LINLDFADIKSIMEDKGKAIMGTGEAEGEDRAVKAAEQALSNPLLDDCSMYGAKGVLINITGGPDITLFEIDEAASRIKEEVDEDANIIFGSSYDESLAGKIRVSIVATGIGGANAPAKPNPIKKAKEYLAETYVQDTEPLSVTKSSADLDSNLEKFSAVSKEDYVVAEENAEVVSIAEKMVESVEARIDEAEIKLEPRSINDFDMLETSAIMNDMPKSSALFNAIINKNGENNEVELANALVAENNTFMPKTTVRVIEEEPELFPAHNTEIFAPKRTEEPEQLIISEEDDEDYTPTLIERVTGFSIARRNRKKLKEKEAVRVQEPISPSFSDDYSDEKTGNNLDIPSFLRRR